MAERGFGYREVGKAGQARFLNRWLCLSCTALVERLDLEGGLYHFSKAKKEGLWTFFLVDLILEH